MNLKMKKSTALLLSVMMLLSAVFSGSLPSFFAAGVEDLAIWNFSGVPSGEEPFPATGGELAGVPGMGLSCNASGAYAYATSSLNKAGWSLGNYWQLKLSTEGWADLSISFDSRSSGTGPRDFKVAYSTDGTNFVDLSPYSISTTSLSTVVGNLALPSAANNVSALYIRMILTSTTSQRAGTGTYPATDTIQSGGVNNVNNVIIKGTNEGGPPRVTIAPDTSVKIVAGQAFEMTTTNPLADIYYQINGESPSGYTQYDSAAMPVLSETDFVAGKAYIMVYSVLDGVPRAPEKHEYSQKRVENVNSSPATNSQVAVGGTITLSAEAGAVIKYKIDGGAEQTYNGPITVTSDATFEIRAWAEKTGYLTSNERTFIFNPPVETLAPYFGQLHSHTNLSDGAGTVTDAFSHASTVSDLDFLAVTDHSNSFEGASGLPAAGTAHIDDAKGNTKWTQGKTAAANITTGSFLGLYGFEMTWSGGLAAGASGHINTFNTPGFENRNAVPYNSSNKQKALTDYYDVLYEKAPDSLSMFNHPGVTFGDFYNFGFYTPERDTIMKLIEVGNGEGAIRSSGYFPSYEYYTKALDKGWHIAPANNQDNHKGKWGDANTARTVALMGSLSENNLYDAIRNNRVYATEDKTLVIDYTLNGNIMGSVIGKPVDGKANIHVEASTTDNTQVGKVEVIVNGGLVAATKNIDAKSGSVDFTLDAKYSYYYIRTTAPSKDLAVTAPVWIGDTEKVDVELNSDTALKVQNKPFDLKALFSNNENVPVDVKSVKFTIGDTVIHEVAAVDLGSVNAFSQKEYKFDYTSAKPGTYTVTVTVIAQVNGAEKKYEDNYLARVLQEKSVGKVLIDGTHFNDYVTGYYKNNMKNFMNLAKSLGAEARIEESQITAEMLTGEDKPDLLIVSSPLRRNDQALAMKEFDDDFISLVADYVKNGGTAILCTLSAYQNKNQAGDTGSTVTATKGSGVLSSAQMNKILTEMGASSMFNADTITDDVQNPGVPYRLFFSNYNNDSSVSTWLDDVQPEQKFSCYSWGSVIPDGENAQWLVKGDSTTYSFNDHSGDILGAGWISIPVGNPVYALTTEKVGEGRVFLAGGVFMSDFEITAEEVDNYYDLYSNNTIISNIIKSVLPEPEITPIAVVRKGSKDDLFTIEGTVTAGSELPNAFFDAAYLQDDTGGITIFPIQNGAGVTVGQKLRVTGMFDIYEGDIELRIDSYKVIDTAQNMLEPKEFTTQEAADYEENGGWLAEMSGVVQSVETTAGGVISEFVIDDGSGPVRVFINEYIKSSQAGHPELNTFVLVGANVNVIGLLSADPKGSRVRVRDLSEVTAAPAIDVSWSGIAANGTSNSVNTTELTLTFDKSIVGLTADNVTVTDAAKGTLTGSGTTWKLAISNITVADGENVKVELTNPAGYSITPANKTVQVWVKEETTTEPTESTGTTATEPTESTGTTATEPTESTGTTATKPTEPTGTTATKPTEPTNTAATKQTESIGTTPTGSILRWLLGDADQDEKITVKDATRVQKHVAKMQAYLLNGLALRAADADEDGKITVKDATVIQKYVAKFNLEGKPGKNIGKWFDE